MAWEVWVSLAAPEVEPEVGTEAAMAMAVLGAVKLAGQAVAQEAV